MHALFDNAHLKCVIEIRMFCFGFLMTGSLLTHQFASAFLKKTKMLVAQNSFTKLWEKNDKDVETKYGLPKNTKSTLVQNKDETLSSLEKEQNVKRQKLCAGNHGIRRSRF